MGIHWAYYDEKYFEEEFKRRVLSYEQDRKQECPKSEERKQSTFRHYCNGCYEYRQDTNFHLSLNRPLS
jgi:hypothetical protein